MLANIAQTGLSSGYKLVVVVVVVVMFFFVIHDVAFTAIFQLAKHNKELAEQLSPTQVDSHGELQVDPALDYYATHTGQIEIVRHDRTLEQIVFPIPEICEYLTEETRHRVYVTAERDDQNSKVSDFFSRTDSLFAEMKWQKKLRCELLTVPLLLFYDVIDV